MKVIEPAQSVLVSSILVVLKKDWSLQFFVDFRRRYEVVTSSLYPLPRMDECLDSIGDAKIFSTNDENNGYWRIEMYKSNREKTALTSQHSLYQFTRMYLEWRDTTATIKLVMNVLLSTVEWQYAVVYSDYSIIFTTTTEKQLMHAGLALRLLKDAGVTLQIQKIFFYK